MSSPPPYPGQPGDQQDPNQPGHPNQQGYPDQQGYPGQQAYPEQSTRQFGQQPYGGQQGHEQPWYEQHGRAYGGYPDRPPAYGPGGYPDRPAYDPRGYPAYGTGGPPPRPPRNGVGITALVLGIIAILTFWLLIGGLLGVLAVALGIIGVVRAAKGVATNRGVAIGGLVLGVLSVLGTIAVVLIAWSFFSAVGGPEFYDCLQRSVGDQSAMEQCQSEFEDRLQQESDRLGGG
ncbi:DUF4190 domain-containing protein [Pseudonocardia parietis]|uniref:DUF4190 domain-containing protein n=1 Tax=Pseudonocardia parietis TaxID=570936 RepID=A0ABS4VVR9_9PSEU|nr:DUF4190 domain-containing protein [Pseudonocardia parietis]MBP2368022.1 hypothetical protein [Pseudonocardia parietis]